MSVRVAMLSLTPAFRLVLMELHVARLRQARRVALRSHG